MMTAPAAMASYDAVDLLHEIMPMVRAKGRDAHIEALALAIDALTWLPLKSAPRDGTKILLAVAPLARFSLPGFIAVGHWVEPTDDALDQLGKARRQRFEAAGGWWSGSKTDRPFQRPVLGWRPTPDFDFDGAGYAEDEIVTVGGRA